MNPSASLILTILLAGFPSLLTAQEHVEVEAKWKHSTAEVIAALLQPLSRESELAVVDDGKATLYFNSEPSEVAKLLRKLEGGFPKELRFGSVERVPGKIPADPKQSDYKQLSILINREKALLMGITVGEISSHLQSLKAETGDTEWAQGIKQASITTSDGKIISLNQLITATMMDVKRPLIIKKTSRQ